MGDILNELPVKDLKDVISTYVIEAVHEIIKKRIADNAFIDTHDVKKRYFTSSCEGIESILIPSSTFPELRFDNLSIKFKELPEIISSETQYILDRMATSKKNAGLAPGDPYLTYEKSVKKADKYQVPNLESNAFVISTLIDIRSLILEGYIKDKSILNQINNTINDSVIVILQNHIKNEGWPYSVKEKKLASHLYFTWSILETLNDFLNIDNADGLIDKRSEIKSQFNEAVRWVENKILPDMVNGPLYIYAHDDEEVKFESTYQYLQGLIILHLGKSKKFEDIISFINRFYSVCYRILPSDTYEIFYNLDSKVSLQDSSIAPLALRGIVPTILENLLDASFTEELHKGRISYPSIISDIIKYISEKRTEQKLFANDSEDYELYYTERVIEAFTICYQQLDKIESTRVKIFEQGLKQAHS